MFMLFLLRPTGYRDVTIYALYFFSRVNSKTLGQECPTCDDKRGEGKEEMDHRPSDEKWTRKPVFVQANRNESLSMQLQPFV